MPLVIEARPAAEGSFGDVPPLRKKRCMVEVLPARRRAFLMLKTAIACVAMTVVTFGAVSYAAPEASAGDRPETYVGFTKPSEQRGLGFNGPGVVSKVYVKEGDSVKKGQLLAEQDSRAERADLSVM